MAKNPWATKRTMRGYPFTDEYTWNQRRARLQSQAHWLTKRAIKLGFLPHPKTLRCADCGDPAYGYDHRDYREPLIVAPTCNPCNGRRPRALPWGPKPNNTFRGAFGEYMRRPLKWDENSDLDPELPPLERLVSRFIKVVIACPACGHVSPRNQQEQKEERA